MQEQTHNTDTSGAQPTSVGQPGADSQASLHASLREELEKWRGRVPKLASALRQRTEEVESLRVQLDDLKRVGASGPGRNDAGVRARDELISELGAKVETLDGRYKTAQGELHARNLEVADLKQDLRLWKDKWQSVTQSLDVQAEAAESRQDEVETLNQTLTNVRQQLAERETAQRRSEQSLADALEERESLLGRNEKLFETTEMANRQIESLADSLAEMRQELRESRDREAAAVARTEALQSELQIGEEALRRQKEALRLQKEELRLQKEELQSEKDALRGEAEARLRETEQLRCEAEALRRAAEELQVDKETLMAASDRLVRELWESEEACQIVMAAAIGGAQDARSRDEQVAESAAAAAAALARAEQAEARAIESESAVAEQRAEIARLESCVAGANEVNGQREEERRQLSAQLASQEGRYERLERQLEERSALVVELEAVQSRHDEQKRQLEREKQELDEARHRAERQAKENAQHITQLDDRLERQKALMEELEKELAEAHEASAPAQLSRDAETAAESNETTPLEENIHRLEQLVREQAEELNRERWKRQVTEKEDVGDSNGKMLLVLNQQLNDARSQNTLLLDRVRDLEEELTHIGMQRAGDDLTRIRGIGPRLAEQLNEVGIYHLDQIAELDELTLSDEAHALYAHKGRILRDGWIDQAARLVSH